MKAVHATKSGKTNSSDTSLISSNAWDADHPVAYNGPTVRSSDYTLAVDGNGVTTEDVVPCSGTMVLTVPLATGSKRRILVLCETGTAAITVARTGSDTLGTGTGFVVTTPGDAFWLIDEALGAWGVTFMSRNGRRLRRTVYTTGTAATHTFANGWASCEIEGLAEGGGGGGASYNSGSTSAFGAGGAAGGYFKTTVTNPGAVTTATYTVGSGSGTAGSSSAGTGGTGADTTVTFNGTTYTAKGGVGGTGQAYGSSVNFVAGGAGVAGTNGDTNSPGMPGTMGARTTATTGLSGTGGSMTPFGSGGVGKSADGVGNPGAGYGAGGGGACSKSAARAGGAATGGLVIFTEYS